MRAIWIGRTLLSSLQDTRRPRHVLLARNIAGCSVDINGSRRIQRSCVEFLRARIGRGRATQDNAQNQNKEQWYATLHGKTPGCGGALCDCMRSRTSNKDLRPRYGSNANDRPNGVDNQTSFRPNDGGHPADHFDWTRGRLSVPAPFRSLAVSSNAILALDARGTLEGRGDRNERSRNCGFISCPVDRS